jgi:hypothetical protein
MRARRGAVVVIAAIVAASLLASSQPALAQVTEICVAGKIVARIRTKGKYGSLAERERKINQAIVEVQSKEDCNHPKITVAMEGNTPVIMAWKHRIMEVYPEDAQPTGLTPKALAAQWKANLEKRLPEAVPVSKMTPDNPAWPYSKPGATKPPATTPSTPKPPATKPPATESPATKPPGTTTAGTTPGGSQPTRPSIQRPSVPAEAAREAVVVAFEKARWLSDEGYVMQQKELAEGLLAELETILSPKPGWAPGGEAGTGEVSTTPPTAEPVMVTEPAVPGATAPSPTEETATPAAALALTRGEALAKILLALEQIRKLPDAQYLLKANAEADVLVDSLRPYLAAPTASGEPEVTWRPTPTAEAGALDKNAVKERIANLRAPYLEAQKAGRDVGQAGELIQAARKAWYANDFARANDLAAQAEAALGLAPATPLEPIEVLPPEAEPIEPPPAQPTPTKPAPTEMQPVLPPAGQPTALETGLTPSKQVIKDKIAAAQIRCNEAAAAGQDVTAVKTLLKDARAAWYANDFDRANALADQAAALLGL